MTVLTQKEIFDGFCGFEPVHFSNAYGDRICYKGPDGFYKIDHFAGNYVIEFAATENEARLNRFEDGDLFDDDVDKKELIEEIRTSIIRDIETLQCPLVDREIDVGDCVVISDIGRGMFKEECAPAEFRAKRDWKDICKNCKYSNC